MAKITPSALITAIQGKWNGSCFQMWKGAITVRRSPRPRKIISESRYNFKGTVSSLSGCFYSMTPDQRIAWRAYAILLPTQITGYNAFMARGTALEIASHSDLCVYFDAPAAYDPPVSPAPISLCYHPSTALYCVMWTNPNCASVYVQGLLSVQAMYSNEKSPKWRIFDTVPSTDLNMIFDASSFPADQMIRFTARSINMRGELSIKAEAKPPPPLPESVTLLYPTGGESLYTGSSCQIEWRSKSVDNIMIDYSINNGVDWILITNSVSALLGLYTWTIPVTESAVCKVRITDTADPTNYDESDPVFSIINKPWVTLTAPNGSEEWEEKTKHNITWNHNNAVNVVLQYSSNNGLSYTNIIASTPAAAGSYEWTVPEDISTQCLVKVLIHENQTIFDVSDNTFSIIEVPFPTDCVAWWLLKTAGYDAGNSRFTDQTGNNHHFSKIGGTVGADSTYLNGSTDYFSCPDFPEIGNGNTKLSVAIWIKTTDTSGGVIVHSGPTSGNNSWGITFFVFDLLFFVDKTGNWTVKKQYKTSKNCRNNSWHLIGFTFDSGTFKVFIDGVEDTAATKTYDNAMTTIHDCTHSFDTGRLSGYHFNTGYLSGYLSKAYIFAKALTPSDWNILFDQGH